MNSRRTVLAQVLAALSNEEFSRCAKRYLMCRDTPALSAYDHFATMVIAQLTYRERLCDIEVCLNARRPLLYHAGIRGTVKHCNLAYANEHRDWRLFAELAGVLMRRARRLYGSDSTPLDLDADLFALDTTLIELSLALFPWARWQGTQAAVKLNVLLDLLADLPSFASLHEGDRHEVASLEEIPVVPGAYYAMDRGYLDFARLHRLHAAGGFWRGWRTLAAPSCGLYASLHGVNRFHHHGYSSLPITDSTVAQTLVIWQQRARHRMYPV